MLHTYRQYVCVLCFTAIKTPAKCEHARGKPADLHCCLWNFQQLPQTSTGETARLQAVHQEVKQACPITHTYTQTHNSQRQMQCTQRSFTWKVSHVDGGQLWFCSQMMRCRNRQGGGHQNVPSRCFSLGKTESEQSVEPDQAENTVDVQQEETGYVQPENLGGFYLEAGKHVKCPPGNQCWEW